jgi:hypothetical protein
MIILSHLKIKKQPGNRGEVTPPNFRLLNYLCKGLSPLSFSHKGKNQHVSGTPDILNIPWANCFVNGFYEQKTKCYFIKAHTQLALGGYKGATFPPQLQTHPGF